MMTPYLSTETTATTTTTAASPVFATTKKRTFIQYEADDIKCINDIFTLNPDVSNYDLERLFQQSRNCYRSWKSLRDRHKNPNSARRRSIATPASQFKSPLPPPAGIYELRRAFDPLSAQLLLPTTASSTATTVTALATSPSSASTAAAPDLSPIVTSFVGILNPPPLSMTLHPTYLQRSLPSDRQMADAMFSTNTAATVFLQSETLPEPGLDREFSGDESALLRAVADRYTSGQKQWASVIHPVWIREAIALKKVDINRVFFNRTSEKLQKKYGKILAKAKSKKMPARL